MGSLTAAAGLVWATLLVCVAVGAAGQSIESLFPEGSLPPSVRIHLREEAALNVAVRDGNVVLATADCKDESQLKWYRVYTSSSFSGPIELKPFSLVNAQTFQVITIPSASGAKVGLSGTPITASSQEYLGSNVYKFTLLVILGVERWVSVSLEELWTPEKPTRDDGFYQLSVANNASFTLNGLGDGVRDGTEVGIYFASPNQENGIWKLTTSSTTCSP